MIRLKKIYLQNYCGYRNFEVNLSEPLGTIKKWQIFYGPNGIGKSNFIRAVDYLASPRRFLGRQGDNALVFRKLKYHLDYIAGVEALSDDVPELFMEAHFQKDDEKTIQKVTIKDNIIGPLTYKNRTDKKWISGVVENQLSPEILSASLYIDADNPSNMNSFQLPVNLKDPFLDFAKNVYGFDVFLPENSIVEDGDSTGFFYYTDFVLLKKSKFSKEEWKVHYKRFSAGEKKIATLLSTLFIKAYNKEDDDNSIILIDNIDQHIYFKRHMTLLKKIDDFFPHHQVLATTHSSEIVKNFNPEFLVDLENMV